MLKNQWLAKLKSVIGSAAPNSSSSTSPRRRKDFLASLGIDALEPRVMLSVQAFAHSGPSITNIGSEVTYAPGGSPVVLASGAKIADPSNAYTGSVLTAEFPFNSPPTSSSQLSIVAANGVTVSAGSILYNGTAIGTETGGTSGAPLSVTFNASATQASVQAVLDNIAYSSSAVTPTFEAALVIFKFTDGNGHSSPFAAQEIQFVNPAAISNIGEPVTYSAGATPVQIAPNAVVTDTNGAFANSSLNIQFVPHQSASSTDVLSIANGNGVTVSAGSVAYNGTTIGTVTGGTAGAALVVTFNASATGAGVQAVLDQVSFSNTNHFVSPGGRAVVLQFTDGNGTESRPAVQFVGIIPAASISVSGPSIQYVEQGAPVLIAPTATVADAVNAYVNSVLDIKFVPGQSSSSTDVLSIVVGNGVSVSAGSVVYNGTTIGTVTGGTAGATLVLTFNTNATQAGVQAVLDQVAYSNSSSTPTVGPRLVEFSFTDGNGSAAFPAFQVVHVLASPAIISIGAPVNYSEGGSPVVLAGTAQVVDNAGAYANSTLTVKVGNFSFPPTDVLSIAAGNGVTVSAGSVVYNGTTIGTVTGGTSGIALSIAFNASATQAGVQAVMDQIAYSNSNTTTLKHSQRVISFQFTDGSAGVAQTAYQVVRVN